MTALTSHTVNKVNVNETRATSVIPHGSISTRFMYLLQLITWQEEACLFAAV